jgi:presenilin 1
LVELAIERDQELPALVYEARPTGGRPYRRGWGGRRGGGPGDTDPDVSSAAARLSGRGEAEEGGSPSNRVALLGGNGARSSDGASPRTGTPLSAASRGGGGSGDGRAAWMAMGGGGGGAGEGLELTVASPRQERAQGSVANASRSSTRVAACAEESQQQQEQEPPPQQQQQQQRQQHRSSGTGAPTSAGGASSSAAAEPGGSVQGSGRGGPEGGAVVEVEDEDDDESPLPDAIKLGLGDFIFYSMLVGRAAMYDMMTGGCGGWGWGRGRGGGKGLRLRSRVNARQEDGLRTTTSGISSIRWPRLRS